MWIIENVIQGYYLHKSIGLFVRAFIHIDLQEANLNSASKKKDCVWHIPSTDILTPPRAGSCFLKYHVT